MAPGPGGRRGGAAWEASAPVWLGGALPCSPRPGHSSAEVRSGRPGMGTAPWAGRFWPERGPPTALPGGGPLHPCQQSLGEDSSRGPASSGPGFRGPGKANAEPTALTSALSWLQPSPAESLGRGPTPWPARPAFSPPQAGAHSAAPPRPPGGTCAPAPPGGARLSASRAPRGRGWKAPAVVLAEELGVGVPVRAYVAARHLR